MNNLNMIKERIKEIVEVLNPMENIGVYTLEETEEKVSFNNEGVYCRWNDCYFRDEEDAYELMKEDENAVRAAFSGWIDYEDRPYVENNYNNNTDLCNVEEVNQAYIELEEIAEELENLSIYIRNVSFKEIIEYIEDDERIKLAEELEDDLEVNEEIKPVKRTKL